MKIAHLVLSNVYAGIEQHVNELILEQQKECEVLLICNAEIEDKFDSSNIVIIKNFSRKSPLGILKLFLLIKKMNLDLIHTHGSKTSSIINSIRKLINIKHVATAHGIKKKTTPFLKADRLIAVSSKIQDSIQRDSIKINNWWSPILPNNLNKKKGRLFKIIGIVAAGDKPNKKSKQKFQTVEIMTGGLLPKGFDTIIPIEKIIFYPNKKSPKFILIKEKIK